MLILVSIKEISRETSCAKHRTQSQSEAKTNTVLKPFCKYYLLFSEFAYWRDMVTDRWLALVLYVLCLILSIIVANIARTVPTLARTVPSLACTVPSLARIVLKPSVLHPRGTRNQRQLVFTDGWTGWDGWDGWSVHFFLLFISWKLLNTLS